MGARFGGESSLGNGSRAPSLCGGGFSRPATLLVCELVSRPLVPCRLPLSVLGERVVGKAVKPALSRLGRGDHAMTARVRVLRGVLVGRIVAASRPAAGLAGSQVHPTGAYLDAVLALPALEIGRASCRESVESL